MTKRSSVRLLSFGLLLAGILIIYAITGTVQAARYRARLESTYRQSLSALAEDLEGIETDLTKSVYANGAATLSDVSRDLSQQANQAKDSLSRLPVEQMNLAGTYKARPGTTPLISAKKSMPARLSPPKSTKIYSGCCNTPPNIKTV